MSSMNFDLNRRPITELHSESWFLIFWPISRQCSQFKMSHNLKWKISYQYTQQPNLPMLVRAVQHVCSQFRAISFYCSLQGKNGSFFLNCPSSTAARQHQIHGGNFMLISHLTSLVSCKDSTRVLEWAHGTVGKLGNKITVTTSLSSIYYSAELRPISRG